MNCNCDKCKKEFEIKPRIKKFADGIEETFFICPGCNERYSSYFTDKDIRKKQAKLRNKYNEIVRAANKDDKMKLMHEHKQMQSDLQADMKILKINMK